MAVVMNRAWARLRISLTPRGWLRWTNFIGIGSILIVSICVNLLSIAWDQRFDATADRRYTLAAATREALATLAETVSVYVLVSHSDPLFPTIKPIVDDFASLSVRLRLRWIDPDREPGQFLAQQTELGIVAGGAKEGKSLSDSVVVLERGTRRIYLTSDDVAQVDPETGDVEPRFEQSLIQGLRKLFDDVHSKVCFTQGHRELSLEDHSPDGLSELKARMSRDSIDVRILDDQDTLRKDITDCNLVIVAEPELPFSPWATEQVSEYRNHSGSLWIMSGTVPDELGRVRGTGLDALLPELGVSLGNNVVVEEDESLRLPNGFGETFFAKVVGHPVTRALSRETPNRSLNVLVSLAPAIKVAQGAPVQILLRSGRQSIPVSDVSSYLKRNSSPPRAAAVPQELTLAIAAELGVAANGSHRRLVVAPASTVVNRALSLVGNRAFVDGVLSWLLAKPTVSEVGSPHRVSAQLALSDADLSRLNRYVLVCMPAAVLVLWFACKIARRLRHAGG
jgi:hypothetical protein